MNSKALVVGSVAFDVIFGIHGDIRREIIVSEGKVGKVNMMFTAKGKQRYYGGTGGNIAYGLGLLGQSPLLFSVAGKDFKLEYEKHLVENKVDLRVITKDNGFTASFYGISDEEYQQIGIWQPDVYGDNVEEVNLADSLSNDDFSQIKVAIFSPGTGISTRNHLLEFKKKQPNALIIFDPSQVLSIFYDKSLLRECLSVTDIFIGNETEVSQLKTVFGYDVDKTISLGLKAIVETRGEDGCIIHEKSKTTVIPPFKPLRLVETTGAGDAFRSGLIYGLLKDKSLELSCKIGAFMGAKNVEEFGGQMYQANILELNSLIIKNKKS